MQRRALAVQCCTYLKQQALAVERLARCKRRRRRNLHPAGNIKYFMKRGGAMRCRALAVQCCAYLKQQALAVERLARCNNDVGATCILQGTIIIYTMEGGYAVLCCLQCFAAPT